ncbi:FAD-binding oxidoreductase [Candidatus Latescibacterota bacterium]
MFDKKAVYTASQCRHYAMCKIDFLDTGVCHEAEKRHYVSFYPQGRMGIYYALSQKRIPLTARVIELADTCNLCGICDKQCYFITGLRPMIVMNALKEYVESMRKNGNTSNPPAEDKVYDELCSITGRQWSSNDPADLAAYAEDPAPVTQFTLPRYVTLPGSKEEVAQILAFCSKHEFPWAIRGNGSSVMGFVMSPGVIIDLHRMKTIDFDIDNWSVTVGPGVAAFELQKAVFERGFRVNTAEASALMCANIMCSGIFSLFSATYGTMADNAIDAQFVSNSGEIFNLNDRNSPNLFSFTKKDMPLPGICTKLTLRLHPILDDEEGVLVPFETIEEALSFSRDLSMRRIGTGIGILGNEYISSFMSPTKNVDIAIHTFLEKTIGLGYLVLVLGTEHDREYIQHHAETVIDKEQFRTLLLGLPGLLNSKVLELLEDYRGSKPAFHFLFQKEIFPVVEAVLNPSPDIHVEPVDEDLRNFYSTLYKRQEMTDLVWLNSFRILSARLGRKKHVVAFIVYVPFDKPDTIVSILNSFSDIAGRHEIDNEFGFITPLDMGKRAVLEYDYFLDHRDNDERERMLQAMQETAEMIEGFSQSTKGVTWIRYVLRQGIARKEAMLYGNGIPDEQ